MPFKFEYVGFLYDDFKNLKLDWTGSNGYGNMSVKKQDKEDLEFKDFVPGYGFNVGAIKTTIGESSDRIDEINKELVTYKDLYNKMDDQVKKGQEGLMVEGMIFSGENQIKILRDYGGTLGDIGDYVKQYNELKKNHGLITKDYKNLGSAKMSDEERKKTEVVKKKELKGINQRVGIIGGILKNLISKSQEHEKALNGYNPTESDDGDKASVNSVNSVNSVETEVDPTDRWVKEQAIVKDLEDIETNLYESRDNKTSNEDNTSGPYEYEDDEGSITKTTDYQDTLNNLRNYTEREAEKEASETMIANSDIMLFNGIETKERAYETLTTIQKKAIDKVARDKLKKALKKNPEWFPIDTGTYGSKRFMKLYNENKPQDDSMMEKTVQNILKKAGGDEEKLERFFNNQLEKNIKLNKAAAEDKLKPPSKTTRSKNIKIESNKVEAKPKTSIASKTNIRTIKQDLNKTNEEIKKSMDTGDTTNLMELSRKKEALLELKAMIDKGYAYDRQEHASIKNRHNELKARGIGDFKNIDGYQKLGIDILNDIGSLNTIYHYLSFKLKDSELKTNALSDISTVSNSLDLFKIEVDEKIAELTDVNTKKQLKKIEEKTREGLKKAEELKLKGIKEAKEIVQKKIEADKNNPSELQAAKSTYESLLGDKLNDFNIGLINNFEKYNEKNPDLTLDVLNVIYKSVNKRKKKLTKDKLYQYLTTKTIQHIIGGGTKNKIKMAYSRYTGIKDKLRRGADSMTGQDKKLDEYIITKDPLLTNLKKHLGYVFEDSYLNIKTGGDVDIGDMVRKSVKEYFKSLDKKAGVVKVPDNEV